MNSKNKIAVLVLGSFGAVTGCVTTNQSAGMMDPYDPRNNIPLLQAATRSSGVGVPASVQVKAAVSQSQSGASVSNAQKMRELKVLKDEGILTQREYDTKKAELLKGF